MAQIVERDLHHLQQLGKWRKRSDNVSVGTLVLIKIDILSAATWTLGRVHQVHPGDDGLVRVVTVKTANSLVRRPLSKICLLPVRSSVEEDNKAEAH